MYVVDMVDLKNQVAFSLILISADPEQTRGPVLAGNVAAYVPVVLDGVLYCLNDKVYRNPSDSLDMYVRETRNEDTNAWAMGEIIEQLTRDIKRKFYGEFGYDPRLYFKLQKLGNVGNPVYRFVMDLDRTFLDFEVKEEKEVGITHEVSDNPSQEELNELFNRCYC